VSAADSDPSRPAAGGAPALGVDGLSVRFGDAPGIVDLSCAVAAGERLAVVGASGAGKTTLLRAIAGLAPVSAGRVTVAGRDVTRLPPERRDVVYLHQTPVLFPHLSVLENVAFPLRVRGAADAAARARVAELLAAVRLEGLERRAPATLSGGQRHRVALARAMAARPAVLLLDEPLSSLDPALRDEVREAILAVQERGALGSPPALVVVTHDFDEAGLIAHRVAVLADQRIAQIAPPAELFRRPASLAVARFLGFANELPGVVRGGGLLESPLGVVALGAGAPRPGRVVVVCHAEALRVVPAGDAGGAARARVVALRHRADRVTAVLRVGGATVEARVDPVEPPAVGDEVGLVAEARQLVPFAADAGDAGDAGAGA
jgi:ABC-type Fe3+/spermidine/putrescine transport system ATPase subunit